MEWDKFLKINLKTPVINTEDMRIGGKDTASVEVQLTRWQKAGKLIQLKRGIYLLEQPYRKIEIYEPFIASLLVKPSYISLEKALEYYGMIPESVTVYTSVTTKRPVTFRAKIGIFNYRHIKPVLFWGYESVTINKQSGFIASPEKALLDYFYLKGVKITVGYLEEMRLQNVEKINLAKLEVYAEKFNKPGILRAARVVKKYIISYKKQEKAL